MRVPPPLSSAAADAISALAATLLSETPSRDDSDTYVVLGPYRIQLNLVGPELAAWAPQHFAHVIEAEGPVDLTIRARIDPAPLAALEKVLREHIELTPGTSQSLRWGQRRVHLEIDAEGLAACEVIDLDGGRAAHLGASLRRIREIDGIRPFLVLLRWWSESTSHIIVHTAAVGDAQTGVLIAGTPGAGKSSTSLASVGGKLRLVGDDIVLMGPDGRAHGIHSTLRLRPDMIDRFGPDAWFGNQWSDWRQKPSQILPQESLRHLIRTIQPAAVVLPRLDGGSEPVFRRVPVASALRATAPVTVTRLYLDPAEQLRKLTTVIAPLPCFEFSVVPDLVAIRTAFENFVQGLQK